MGNRPLRPEPDEAKELKADFHKNCALSAFALFEADVLILVTGAGFSADSGLAVYADVANVKAYEERNLTYQDICTPQWLHSDPELFYGFWGQCFNDYRKTQPHDGYSIIKQWRDAKNSGRVASELRALTEDFTKEVEEKSRRMMEEGMTDFCLPSFPLITRPEPYDIEGYAGAFFTFTSNVDAHSFDVFQANEIREIHGNVELWQCSQPNCCRGGERIFRAPLGHSFTVDTETMLAPMGNGQPHDAPNSKPDYEGETETIAKQQAVKSEHAETNARISKTLGSQRQYPLRFMPHHNSEFYEFTHNHPRCHICRSLARPAILMFDDLNWVDNDAQEQRWHIWNESLISLCEDRAEASDEDYGKERLKICILEVGCGDRVRTCRMQSEDMLETLTERGGDVTLIRVNPDFPLADDPENSKSVISIMSRGLEAIREIDVVFRRLSKKGPCSS
mmetsp:Transcript_11835/g.17393  ORF Transcript_11835/g.17393 Transcript_11835/m.17393 type:complete len:450 (-) Transcript_11835:307-1656(-)